MSKNYNVTHLEWDSNYFKVNSSKAELINQLSEIEKIQLSEQLKPFEFTTIINRNSNNSNNIWLSTLENCYLVDINIQYIAKQITVDFNDETGHIIVSNGTGDEDELISIARSSFEYSRFFNDPNLPIAKSREIYTEWVKSSINDSNKNYCIYKKNNKVSGFLLFSCRVEEMIIELIAVDKSEVRSGIGLAMVNSLKKMALESNIKTIKVGTQISNIQANNFYSKCGFFINQTSTVFHLWSR